MRTMTTWDDQWEAIILASTNTDISHGLLSEKTVTLNKRYKHLAVVALEDHHLSEEHIDGVKMNHGKLVFVVVLRLARFNKFSETLPTTKY